ncbi:L,D-transpeptidase family protein [Halarcobacter sp.]|uniref:L,D-transpeptidase family protein n=1 Tax=Halarcobacter sp. TaxID=2321133 RepID=UPI002AA91482|nr:L,D-transpeptidase family protein [Halarcobacter sp.]
MKKTLLFLILIINVLAADLVDVYRSEGLEAVKEELEKELMKKEYWQKYLADKRVDYGYYESKKYLILTQKRRKEITLFEVNKNSYNILFKDSVIVGEKDGDKQDEGDLRTPIGVYDLTNKLTKLDDFYGPLALVTSYPNTFDKIRNKKGSGIWIHGMPLNEERESFTKGCIALDNPKLEELDKSIDYDKSILLISETVPRKASRNEISVILSSIYKWRDAWKKSDLEEYLRFYSDSFKRHDGMDLERFRNYKERIFSKKEKKTILFSNINIVPYPNALNKNMFKVIMDEDYKTKYYTFVGKKELYIEVKDNQIKILAEG